MPANQVVGNAGLYYTCYTLSRRGWNVMPTSRNARGIDIVAYDADGSRYVGIQVKTLSKREAVPLGQSIDRIRGERINGLAHSVIASRRARRGDPGLA